MLRIGLMVALWSVFPLGFAQHELVTVFDGFSTELEKICGITDEFDVGQIPGVGEIGDGLTWVCGLRPSIDRAKLMIENLMTDVNGFFENSLSDLLNTVGEHTGLNFSGIDVGGVVSSAADGIRQSLEQGSLAFSPLVNKLVAEANVKLIDNLTADPDPNAGPLERRVAELAGRDPSRIAAELNEMDERSSSLSASAEAQDLSNMARETAKGAFARGDEEQLFKRVTSPDPTSMAKGAADKVDDLARTSNSSRALFAANVRMATEGARAQVVGINNVVTAVKELGLQATYQTQQMANFIETQHEANRAEGEKWRADYIETQSENMFNISMTRGTLLATSEMLKMPDTPE